VVVLHLITGLNAGGAEASLFKLLVGMEPSARTHHKVISLTDLGVYGPRLNELGVDVSALGLSRGQISAGALWRVVRLIRRSPDCLVQGWMYHGNLLASLACLIALRPRAVLWNIRNGLSDISGEKKLTKLVIALGRVLSFLPRKIIYAAKSAALQHEAYGYKASRSVVITNGYDLQRFTPDASKRQSERTALNIAPQTLVIVHVARWDWTKDHATFFAALALLKQILPDISLKAVCVGDGLSAQNDGVARQLQQNGLVADNDVLLQGYRRDIEQVMCAGDIFCLSSRTEAHPNVVGEAMACGLPVVSTEVGDAAEIIGGTGLVVPAQNAQALAQALATLCQETEQQRKVRGQLARARIEAHYGLEQMVAQYQALYASLCKSPST
jgi:glycosyltransferase involved in cell wall biosynthesis